MSLTTYQKFKIRKFLKELRNYKARHTELVTVYIPAGYDINKIMNHLGQEQGTAKNIKSAATRNNVIDALEKMMQHLRLFKQTPENGLAVFSGNVAEREGQIDVRVWSLEPPIPMKTRIYRCEKDFQLDILEELLETKEVYGLVVMDARDADIALLKGKAIVPLTSTHSHVPGKMKAGGQCLLKDTLIQLFDGNIIPIKNTHNPHILKSAVFEDSSLSNSPITAKWDVEKEKVYKITTKYPRLEVQASKDHIFFVSTCEGIIEKPSEDLKEGDFLIMPEKIDIVGVIQSINYQKYYNSKHCQHFNHQGTSVKLPPVLSEEFAQFLGYLIGDGCIEQDRVTFFEQDKKVAMAYKDIFEKFFKIKISYKFRTAKNYHQLRFTSRPLVRLIKEEFPEIKKSNNSTIPEKILLSPNNILAAFLKGLFDADGYVSLSRKNTALSINNKMLAQQVQIALLRFGMVASLFEYDNRANKYSKNPRYTVDVNDKTSLELFEKNIGFTGFKKAKKLSDSVINRSSRSNTRQVFSSGKTIRKIIERAGYNLQLFPKVNNFFRNERMMSKEVFKSSILSQIKDKKLRKELEKMASFPFLPVKINKIESFNKSAEMVDISVKNQNFIANGVIVHNSSVRFAANRALAVKAHMKKVADMMKDQFLARGDELKGILVGGPGPVKYDFVDSGFITGDVKKKIIAIKDISYTGPFGLEDLVDRSQDVLAKEEIADEKQIVNRFLTMLAKNQKQVAYGEQDVMKAVELGAAEVVLISIIVDDDKIEGMEELAKQFGTEVKIISTDTREGVQLRDLGKFGAILRFEVEL